MYKNQLQELAQRSCFSLPSYTCIREGPDHAPRFKASVNFNGEIFESPAYCSTLRQAEHAAAEFALNLLSSRVPSKSLTAKVLDESGIYKNLLQETAHRAGLDLPIYTSVRLGAGYISVFSCTVELAGMKFTGESAKTKKQAEKNAAIAAWSSLKRMSSLDSMGENEEKEQEVVERVLSRFRPKEVKRREPNHQWRRRTFTRTNHQDENKDLLIERLRWINLLTNQASSSSQKPHKTSFSSLNPPLLPPKSSKTLPLTTNLQQYQGKSSIVRPEMLSTKQFALLKESSNSCRNQFNLNPNRLAPPVQIRSIIPVFAAPPPKPNPDLSSTSTSTSRSSINQSKSAVKLRDDQITLGLDSKP